MLKITCLGIVLFERKLRIPAQNCILEKMNHWLEKSGSHELSGAFFNIDDAVSMGRLSDSVKPSDGKHVFPNKLLIVAVSEEFFYGVHNAEILFKILNSTSILKVFIGDPDDGRVKTFDEIPSGWSFEDKAKRIYGNLLSKKIPEFLLEEWRVQRDKISKTMIEPASSYNK